MKLGEIAQRLECQLEGDPGIEITGIATLETAREGEISFLTNIKYFAEAKATRASALIVGPDCSGINKPLLKHHNPYLVFAKAIELLLPPPPVTPSIHPTAWIASSARLGERVSVGAFCFVGEEAVLEDDVIIGPHCVIHQGVTIGEKTIIHSGCAIRERATIGRRCIIQNNAVIGSDGFGFARRDDGTWHKIFQAGTVVIEDDVEVGAGSTIDRATLGETRIKSGTKLDNLVHVGHGCEVGRDTLLCAQVGLAGSTTVGNKVILAGQVGAAGHLTIGDGVTATAQSGIPGSIEPNTWVSGSPAMSHKDWLKSSAVMPRLPEIQKAVKRLERRIEKLEEQLK
ncbi:MAG: UDP-3-O-(3-hydroxymyristoyl)glucosamine N-acyltransferase [Acidobacteriota bacterium]